MKIAQLMQKSSIYSCEEFWRHLLNNEALFGSLIEELTISQSYFFRERVQFDMLIDLIHNDYIAAPSILSLPCARGEEPYSIAITLLQNGIKSFFIDAIDISMQAIAIAKDGKYEKRECKNIDENTIKKFFDNNDNYYIIKDLVKERINFYVMNLFDKNLLHFGKYDFIFCRNLFIYLDDQKKQEALQIFHTLLKEGGYLFLSFSDYFKTHPGFVKIAIDNKIYYKKSVI